jgi:hypothetical protein
VYNIIKHDNDDKRHNDMGEREREQRKSEGTYPFVWRNYIYLPSEKMKGRMRE